LDQKKAQSLPKPGKTLKKAKKTDVLELDELWSYVCCKAIKAWLWIALCRRTRLCRRTGQVVAYAVGQRNKATCRRLWQSVPKSYRRCRSRSDFLKAYRKVIDSGKHHCVGKDSGETAHIERFNNTLPQRICRLVRKTLSFSKSWTMHELYVKLFIHFYNLALNN
jgi:insertion element IS1 protein InsB